MRITFTPTYRALAIGGAAAAILIGAFALGITTGHAAPSSPGQRSTGAPAEAVAFRTAGSGRITVTGTGTVTGTPNQLVLSMGVQVNGGSVESALQQANQAINRVTSALEGDGVAARDIQTSNLYIQPNYPNNSQIPNGYGVNESITATLRHINEAGAQIEAAVHAGGDVVTIDGISLNLTDTSHLLARARAAAVADARTKAAQYASAAGQSLGPVVAITDQASVPPFTAYNQSAGATPKASVPISPGSQQLSVSVTVVFALG